ncbi:pitrilysin family protein [Pleionea sp. CnH1-48]|uniref:M16 family metallopeptidase n=1 Tax=Pleionea sp. CnH1-48 TaxID=2954494 RepID=UPI002097FAC7|nr:pitrilysin family protein [Pleionea sp. CnH1-48]MCO7224787.1 insulinase family protein [Pleionea sp. CnH1-48]
MTSFKRIIAASALTVLMASCAAPSARTAESKASEAPAADKVFNLPYTMTELDNGLKVILVKTDYPDLVSIQIPMQTGSRNEVEKGKSGFAHFFEHMMFKGTESTPRMVYENTLKNAGADGNAYTSDDLTNYHLTFPKEHLETVIKLEADRFQNLTYTEAEFRTEALAVKGEYLKNNANPIRKALEEVRDLAYDVHTYKHTTMGYLRDIEDMPNQLEYSKEFFKRWYTPQLATVILVGDIDNSKTLELVKKYWGNWKRSENNVVVPQEPKQQKSKYKHVKVDGLPKSHLLVSYHAPRLDDTKKDKQALDLMDTVYFSATSDLYQDLVVQRQLVDQFFTYYPNRKDSTLFHVFARLKKPEYANQVNKAIADTLVKARTELVDSQRLNALKSNLKYNFANAMDSTSSIAGTLASFVHFQRDPELINRLYRSLDSITAEDIRHYANQYMIDSNRVTVTLSNSDDFKFANDISVDYAVKQQKGHQPQTHFKWLELANQSDLVDVSFLFNTGAANDPKGKKGLAALTAAMITNGGSATKGYADIQKAMFPIAGQFSYQIDKEMLVFRGRVHKDNLDAWYSIVRDMLFNPGWREEDFDRVKNSLISGIDSGLKASNDEELGKEVLYSELYHSHPYASYNLGATDDLKALTLDDLKFFYNGFLTQKRLTLGVSGNIPESFKKSLKKDLATLNPGKSATTKIADAPKLKGRKVTLVQKDSAISTAVSFGFPIEVTRKDKDWTALWLMRSWLGEHRNSNSHLYQRIRAARGMNYGDYAYVEYFPRGMFQQKPDANLGRSEQIFQIWLRPLRSNNDAHFATRTAMVELEKMINNGLTEEQFESTRNFLYNFAPQLVGNQSKQLGYELDSRFYGTDSFVDYVRKQLKSLTKDEVNRIIKKHLQMDNIQFVFITADAKDMKKRLVSEQTSPLKYNSPKGEDIQKEDKIIQDYPLKIKKKNVKTVNVEQLFK